MKLPARDPVSQLSARLTFGLAELPEDRVCWSKQHATLTAVRDFLTHWETTAHAWNNTLGFGSSTDDKLPAAMEAEAEVGTKISNKRLILEECSDGDLQWSLGYGVPGFRNAS
ncbi:hypothetical protein WJX82_003183 [Trebouxia sp. C0006]